MELKNLQKHIRNLVTLEETEAPVISCYLNPGAGVQGYRHALNERVSLLRKSLSGEARRHFEEAAEPKAVQQDDGSLLVDGLLEIDKFKEILNINKLPDEEAGNYQTVGGFVITQMGKIPLAGQWFEWGKYHFEVVDMDLRRVDKVLVTLT